MPALISSSALAQDDVPADAEALVVAAAFDSSMPSDRVAALVATWPWTAWDAHPAETKLVISTATDGSAAGDAALEDVAQEHGFETVFWRQTEPRDQWDRVGASRVIDALEATMWRSMRVLGTGPPRLADAADANDVLLLDGADHHDDGANPDRDTAPAAHAACDDEDDDWTAWQHASEHPDSHADDDVGRDLDALDAVFARLAHVRATSHDADPAHRRAAANSAMRALWGVLGGDSDDDDDEEDVFASAAVARRQR
ncbi:hypothetical protein GGF32_003398 [Allomyces javanicus]|nr:hypothetical protein GGF32_003398 [Allomyces javanicus]